MRPSPISAPLLVRVALLFVAYLATVRVCTAETLRDLIAAMEETSPVLARSRFSVAEARDALARSRSFPNPRLFGEHEDLGSDLPAETAVGVRQDVGFLWSQAPQIAAEKCALAAAEAEYEESRQELIAHVLVTVARYDGLRQLASATDSVLKQAADLAAAMAKRKSVGDISDYDAERFAIELLELTNRRRRLLTDEQEALTELVSLTGLPSDRWRAAQLTLSVPAPFSDTDTAWAYAEEHRPLLRAAALRSEAARKRTRALRAAQLPEVSLGVGSKRIEGGASGFVMEAELELPLFHRRGFAVRLARTEQERAQTALAAARDQVRREIESAVGQLRFHADLDIPAPETAAARAAQNMNRGVALYLQGESSALDLVDALRTALDAWEAAVSLAVAQTSATIALRRAVGMKILE